MDSIISVRANRSKGAVYFLTWGRIQDVVATDSVERLMSDHIKSMTDLQDSIESIEVCREVGEAAEAPFFFESFFEMTQARVPASGWRLKLWRRRMDRRMKKGREIWFLGLPEDRTLA